MTPLRLIRFFQVTTGTLRVALVSGDPGVDAAALVLRGTAGAAARIPARVVREGGRTRIAADLELAELPLTTGSWTLAVETTESGNAHEAAVEVDDNDPRELVLIVPGTPVQAVTATARDGAIRLEVATREPYAETSHVSVVEGHLVVRGRVVGAEPAGSSAELVVRGVDTGAELRRPAKLSAGEFEAELLLDDLPMTRPERWNLDLEAGSSAFRLGRRLDDVVAKPRAHTFGRTRVGGPDGAFAAVPRFDVHHDLLVQCVTRAVPEGEAGAGRGAATRTETGEAAAHRRRAAVTRLLLRLLERLLRLRPARRDLGVPASRRVYFLLDHVYGRTGLHRTVINLANHLVEDHEVEIISLLRTSVEPNFRIDPRVKVRVIDDRIRTETPGRLRARLEASPSQVAHPDDFMTRKQSSWTDVQLIRTLQSLRPGVLVATQVSFNLFAARFARTGVATIGQEHKNFTVRGKLLPVIRGHYPKLDALAVLTSGDQQDFSELLAGASTRVVKIPNAAVPPAAADADLASKRVLAAGGYGMDKGFDLLIRAFAPVAERHPDWQLRIFGDGPQEQRLRGLIGRLGLAEHVLLMPRTRHLEQEMAASSLFVMSSRQEGFGMVIVEAMAVGVPVVSFDCPRGPGEIITDRVTGRLVPDKDVPGLTAAMLEMIEDPAARERYAEAARRDLVRFELDRIGDQWRSLFQEIAS